MAVVVITKAMTDEAFAATAAQSSPAAKQFKTGDAVVYPGHGVGRVDHVGMQDVAGHKIEMIQISFAENQMTIRLPAAKVATTGLRKLSSKADAEKAIAALSGRPRISKVMWSKRAQEYQARINSGDLMALAELLRDLRRNAGSQDGSFSERQIFETALDRFASEIATVRGEDKAVTSQQLIALLIKAQPASAAAAAEKAAAKEKAEAKDKDADAED
ncbi:CarD-like transcriptional regulator [Granulibacter bethesdensis]|uniref:CarD-like transcriptional regulator n=1 Tax=Granulibacter bethesdensis TaxID=364410 RepID=A0AAC9KFA2_9PROT|nr:CarD family transcriptional regulator [Granulibacter bethesdensis]APH55155.1 CarD-like transcriptional regulator [Granulibacter bethesdensis]APH62740.1 CarD-like transcriptional regulator [Granulibacter bethesdensis]